ncbi:MAG: amidase, partial [Marinibacterium sp.]
MADILQSSAAALLARLQSGDLRPSQVMAATLERIADINPRLNAIVSMRDADDLMAEARAADTAPPRGPLYGLPMAVKDLTDVAGLATSEGSPVYAGQVAEADGLVAARLRAAGAIFIGKTNTPEFGLGSHTFNPVFGATRNPYDPTLSCGGSSGGAAVALATRMLALADGSDMMGSLRNPAGWNNVYGFRPTWGRIPGETGKDSFLHQLSTAGPMARSPEDLAILLDVLSGPDPARPHGCPVAPVSPLLPVDPKGMRIGWLGDWGGALPMEPGILALCRGALDILSDLGSEVEDLAPTFPMGAMWRAWTTLRSWQVAAGLAPLSERRDALKDSALWELDRGLALTAQEVHAASVIRSDWFRAAARLFDRFDALVLPSAQVWPFPVDIPWPTAIAGVEMDTYHRWMQVVVPAGLLGLPVLAAPAGFGAHGLPMGVQIIGR